MSDKELNIGQEIVESASEPTKTVEEMKEIMGETDPVEAAESSTESIPENGVPIPPETPFTFPPDWFQENSAPTDDIFDPSIHCVDSSGNAIRTKSGKFRRKRGKSGTSAKREESFKDFTVAAPASTVQLVSVVLDSATLLTAMYLGDEWKARPEERAMLVDAYARYVHYRGWDSAVSPEAALVVVTMTYLMPRIMTAKFVQQMKDLFNAHSHNRASGERQNVAGKSNGSTSGESGNGSGNSGPLAIGGLGGTLDIREINRRFDPRSGQNPK